VVGVALEEGAVRRREDLVWREVDGVVVGVDPGTGRYFSIEGAGAVLWARLGEETTAEGLVDAVVEVFGVPVAVAAADVARFVDELHANDLLEN
jgi:hypothetical protein